MALPLNTPLHLGAYLIDRAITANRHNIIE